MAKRIIDTSPTYPRIIDTSPKPPRLDPAVVAAALGAECVGSRATGGSPLAKQLARQGMLQASQQNLTAQSANGVGSVPLAEMQWQQLQHLAASLAENGSTPTAGQVAGVLLKRSLAGLDQMDLESLRREIKQQAGEQSQAAANQGS